MKFVDKDLVGLLKKFDLLGRDVAEDANAEARTGKWVPFEDLFRYAKIAPNEPHFVFEQFAQRLDQFEIHFLRQAAHIVMRLDRYGRAANTYRFDHIRIKRALNKPFHIADLMRLGVEYVYEFSANSF